MRTLIAVISVLVVGLAAQEAPKAQNGAKALFLDPTSGAAVASRSARTTARSAPAAAKATAPATGVNAGLMYYLEIARPDGSLQRVSPTTIFRSGDRIRIQLQSNVNGRLVIAQRDPDGTSSVLFPDPRVNGGDNRIQAKQLTALPSASTWFRFDDNPGEEHLLVMLTPDINQAAPGVLPLVPPKQWDQRRTEEVTLLAQAQRGSKALVVEVDNSRDSAATYVVQPAGQTVSQGVITTEIILIHR